MKRTATTLIGVFAVSVAFNLSTAHAEHQDPTLADHRLPETQAVHKCQGMNEPKQKLGLPAEERNSK